MDTVKQLFADLLAERNVACSELQWTQFERYYAELVEWNERMNLTGITERKQVFVKHFYDSISLSFYVPLDSIRMLADIGSGAGFPSIPLKIMFPSLQVTIVDSLNKRIQFLNYLVQTLGLDGVQCVHGRAEDIARQAGYRDSFDLVTARAVARLNVLNEFCLPFVRTGGLFVAMKGTNPDEEVKEASKSLKLLQGEIESSFRFQLPDEQSERHLIVIRKRAATPKAYPRKPGLPLKQPLI